MLEEPVGGATSAAESLFGDVSTWSSIGSSVMGAGGGFEFPSAEAIDAVLASWRARQQSITQRGQILEAMSPGLTASPADDDATSGYMAAWSQSLAQLRDQHSSMLDYIENYIQKLEAAKTAKLAGEADTTDAVRKVSGGITQ